jgi:hypothetical protein
MNPTRALVLFAVALSAFSAHAARADDATAQQLLTKAQALYENRGQGDELQNAKDAITTLATAAQDAVSSDLKYDILILSARTYYWQGMHTTGDDAKKPIYLAGQQVADQAAQLNDSYAEAHYYAGINLARWAEANGIVASISHKGQLITYMQKASDITRTTRDGSDGETVDGYGPDRVLGRMYQKLPGVLGGDHNLAVTYLRKTVANAPKLSLNVVYLCDSLYKGSSAEKAEGKATLTALLQNDPTVFGQSLDRVPETIEEFKLAQDLLNGHPVP